MTFLPPAPIVLRHHPVIRSGAGALLEGYYSYR